MKRARPRHEIRDIDLHPDHVAEADAPDGMLQRAKRQLSSSLEEPSIRRLRTTAESLRTTAEARYEAAPSAREVRAATRVAVRDHAWVAAGAAASAVKTANEEFDLMADEVAEVGATIARVAAHRTAQAASAVQGAHAHAASAVKGMHAHGAAQLAAAEQLAAAGTEQAVTAVRASLWGAMSYLQPRLTWATAGVLGFRAATQAATQAATLAATQAAMLAARSAPAAPSPPGTKIVVAPAVATLALEAENTCPQESERFVA